MALSLIDVGTTANDGTGDPLRTAFQTVNTAITALNNNPHRNMLINSTFAINQRLFAGGALTAAVYGHDRWKASTGNADYTVSGETVTLTSGAIEQIIEAPVLQSKAVVFSVEDPTATLTITVAASGSGSGSTSGTITSGSGRRGLALTVPAGATGNIQVKIAGTSAAFARPQFERSTVDTPFDRRPAGLELLLCQRYYQTKTAGAVGVWYTSTNCLLGFQFGQPMRAASSSVVVLNTAPTVGEVGVTNRVGSGSAIVSSPFSASGGQVSLNGFTGATVGKKAVMVTDGVLGFSAEL